MFPTHRTSLLFFGLLCLAGCGAERGLSGIWQQVACDPTDEAVPCPQRVVELHLGRFGHGLTGLVVEYETESERSTFDGSSECDCSFIKSGYAAEDNLTFGVDPQEVEPANTCGSAPGSSQVGDDVLPCSLRERRFNLNWDGEFLSGVMFCRGDDSPIVDVVFAEATGQPRTRCSSASLRRVEN